MGSRYLYTLRVEFEAIDDVDARRIMHQHEDSTMARVRAAAGANVALVESGEYHTVHPFDAPSGVTEKLQRLSNDQPPKLVEWYR